MNSIASKLLIGILFISTVFVSCAPVAEITDNSETNVKSKIRTVEFKTKKITQNEIYQKPLIADLEVAKQKVFMTKVYEKMEANEAKVNIMGEFMVEQNCDKLVQPLYQMSTEYLDFTPTTTISLSGYPAFYKNIRNYTPADANAFEIKSFVNSVSNEKVEKPLETISANIIEPIKPVAPEEKKTSSTTKAPFTIGIEQSNPSGQTQKNSKSGIGIFGQLGIKLAPKTHLIFDLAYLSYAGSLNYNNIDNPDVKLTRLMGGLNFGSSNSLYTSLQLGMSILSSSTNRNASTPPYGGFTYNIECGYKFDKLNIGVLYNATSVYNQKIVKNTSVNTLGLRAGFQF